MILKNKLVENVRGLIRTPESISYKNTIDETISEMKELSPKVYADGLSILRQYYYITTFSRFVSKNNLFDFS